MVYKNIEDRKSYHRRWYKENREKRIKQIIIYRKNKYRELKLLFIKELGGKCSKCGYNKCSGAMDFHHLKDKDNNIAKLIQTRSNEFVRNELKKCVLLCANCHRELHANSIPT